MLQQQRARLGQLDAGPGPVEQPHPQFAFQVADALGQRGLGHVQAFRGPSEVEFLGEDGEVAQMA